MILTAKGTPADTGERCAGDAPATARKDSAGDTPAPTAPALRAPEAHGANQSPALKPTQPKNTEQATRDRGGFRSRAIYLEIIELELEIDTIGLPTGEQQSQDEIAVAHSRSGRDRDIYG